MQKPSCPYRRRYGDLKKERTTWFTHWQELSKYYLPRTGKFLVDEKARGQKKHNNIVDNTGARALRVLGAGLMSGMTSPARPWFRLDAPTPELNEVEEVREWLNVVADRMRSVFNLSNFYRTLHGAYEELGLYGTAAFVVLPDFDDVIRCYPMTAGEYAIAVNDRGVVDTLYREFTMTVAQLVRRFGLDKCTPAVQRDFKNGNLDATVTVLHVVEPRIGTGNTPFVTDMPFASIYLEMSAPFGSYLSESGFKRFPALVPRWAVTPGDIYGNSPGMESLGDTKQLQHQQMRKGTAIDYMVNPPLQAPAGMKVHDLDTLPGGVSFVPIAGQGQGLRSSFEVGLDLNHLLADIQDVRQRINATFFADLFLLLSQDERSGTTAREVIERHEEKLLMLGPVLERLHDELLRPIIDIAFDAMMEGGVVPPPPKALRGQELSVEFVSVLAQAQRAVGVQSIDRLVATVAQISAAKQDLSVWDTLDTDRIVGQYGDMLGVDPHLTRSGDELDQVRQVRAQKEQMQAAAQNAPGVAGAVKDFADARAQDPALVNDFISQVAGYGAAPTP
ncbi:Head-to-tail connector protein, podovirus-type [uncultured Caudovirales phage]|uniref:Head-to-tail connector protein, podovirus-type n=1 Tax=uncultured Caudovirales phage TaxID=2100421 RepID=A0A6J5P090_9CAUD|nr:Head-to-tail connector protein, podovirus-type [uncultured Caudovirales phage]